MRETTNRGTWLQRWASRVCAFALIGLSSGAAFAAPLESARSLITAPAAPQGLKTIAIKKAIKVVVKGLRSAAAADAIAMLTKLDASPAVVRAVVKHSATIATRLESLLVYEDLTLTLIEDQVINVLKHAGVASSTAGTAGFMVKKIVQAAL